MRGKIKVAFFADLLLRDYDGCTRTVFHIIDRLPKDKYEVIFIGAELPKENFNFKCIEITKIRIPFNKNYKMAIPHFNKSNIDDALNEFQPDIIHVTTPSPLGHYALNYASKYNIPVSTIYHTHYLSYVEYYLRKFPSLIPLAKRAVARYSRSFYNYCDKILLPTQEMKHEFELNNISTQNIILWPRGLDNSIFNVSKKDVPRIHSITGNSKPNILFASRLVWEKNLETLANIYSEIKRRKLDVNFLIAGDGVAKTQLMQKMPDAYFLGTVTQEDLSFYYASSDVFVFPSISETYGNVVIEAMASGLPCIVANGGGSKSFVDHGKNGFICEANHASSYVNRIEDIIYDEALKAEFIKKGLEYTKDLEWESLVSKFFNVWDNLITKKKTVAYLAA